VRRLVPTVALTIGLALIAAGCLPPSEPAQNGRLPDTALTTVTGSCRVANDVADPLRRLIYTAWVRDGVQLQPETQAYVGPLPGPPSIQSCYRDFDMQVWWRNFYCFFGNCDLAAVPGTSVHGWGRAVDFEDGGGELTFASAGYEWLQAHAGEFGFVHPAWAEPGGSSPEPWHWEHA
jgi:D-alanyl-D-alanine carboxypeptidase-like protein